MIKMNKIYQGDALTILKTFPDSFIDCIITSPPYWKGFSYESYFNSYKQYLDYMSDIFKELYRVTKKDCYFFLNVVNCSETTVRAYELLQEAIKYRWKLHDTIIWYRYNSQPANTNRQLTSQYEFIFMFCKFSSLVKLNKKELYQYNSNIFDTKNVGNVWKFSFNIGKEYSAKKETKSPFGHSGFPVILPESCIILSTKENDLILDPFIGFGTTSVIAKKLHRNYIGIELEQNYINIAKKRLKNS